MSEAQKIWDEIQAENAAEDAAIKAEVEAFKSRPESFDKQEFEALFCRALKHHMRKSYDDSFTKPFLFGDGTAKPLGVINAGS